MALEMAQHPTTIAEAAGVCFNSFQQCMQQSVSVSPRDTSIVEGQFARFSLWASNIAVFASGRASLDHRLREAPEVQEVISGILEVLDDRINECSSCFEAAQTSPPDAPQDPEKETLEKTRREIATHIALLHRLSNTIRHASSEAQNAKAASTFKILDETGNDVEPWLRIIFVNYVRDKFRAIDENLLQRLVSAMILRRKRVLYRRHRFGNSALRAPQTKPQPAVKAPEYPTKQDTIMKEGTKRNPESGPSRDLEEIPKNKSQAGFSATTLAPEKFKKASAASTVSGAKTVALNKHEELPFPAAPLGGVRKRYNEMKRVREKEHALYIDSLDPTDTAGIEKAHANLKLDLHGYWQESLRVIGEVVCPFCFYAVPALEINEDSKWKSHVRNDLDPYVCLFEECDTPDQLYRHSEEWLKHMREHALRWRCNSKSHGPLVFSTNDQYTDHMKESHRGAFNDAQIRVLANRSARAGPLFESCPFCGMDDFDNGRKIEDHLVGHLRFLALKSLPPYQDEVSEGFESQSASSRVSKPHKRSTIDNDPDRHTTFTFEDRGEILYLDRDDDEIPVLGRAEWNFVLKDTEASAHVETDPILLHLASEQLPPYSTAGSRAYRDADARDQPSCDHESKHEIETIPAQDSVCETADTGYPCVIVDDSDSNRSSQDMTVPKLTSMELPGSRERIARHNDIQQVSTNEIEPVPIDESSVLETDHTRYPFVIMDDSDSIDSSQDTAARNLTVMELASVREHITTHDDKQRVPSPPPSPSPAGYDPRQSRHDKGSIKQRAEIKNTTDDISFPALWPPKMPLQRENHESILMDSDPSPSFGSIEESPSKPTEVTEDLDLDGMISRILETIGRVTKRICLKNQEITAICTRSRELFLSQPMLLELAAPVKIVGDVHGQFTDLIRIFLMSGFPPATNYLFLGDYVDRGRQSLETILLLLCFKLKYPQNFFLLRGNHECANVTRVYGFYDECKRRCNIKIWKAFIDTFNCLPVAAIVAKKIFCVHGGLSPSLAHMDDIRRIERPTDVPDYGLMNDLLWSDPADMEEDWEPNERGVSYCFGKSVIQRFLTRHNFDLICRAHMVVEDGYEFYEDRLLVTVFSASNYCGEFDNYGAVMNVSSELLCSFELIKPELEKTSAAKFRESIRSSLGRSLQSVLSIF